MAAKLISFGKGGHTIHYGTVDNCTSKRQGYETPASFEALPEHDGAPCIDVRDAVDTDAGYRWVFSGPMVDVDLPAGEVSGIDLSPGSSMVADAIGKQADTYGTLVRLHRASTSKAGPLDSVAIPEYLAGWYDNGARVGVVVDGEIQWEPTILELQEQRILADTAVAQTELF
tara:strand:- start:375 stop:890 length:516 start_codon:yes stop_codon:yes gene_type:complete